MEVFFLRSNGMRFKRMICALLLVCLAAALLPAPRTGAQAASPYYVEVDLTNQIVTVYDNGDMTEDGIVRQMICSSGKSSTPTPRGTFTLPKKSRASERTEWYYFPANACYAKWATRIRGGILFHSILYTRRKVGPTKASLRALGTPASHGCVRLKVDDAKWIAQNCPAGTKVKIFKGSKNSGLHKKVLAKTFSRDSQTYDEYMGRETDPESIGSTIRLVRGSTGSKVKKLQKQLKALGFYAGEIDSQFGAGTQDAVKYFQAASGLKETGRVYDSLWALIFADKAPTGTYVTLAEGMKGAAVKKLQKQLKTLKLYTGSAKGTYNAATAEAVRLYRLYFGFSAGNDAPPAVQKDAISRAKEIKARFGSTPYQLVEKVQTVQMAKVTAKTLYMRKKASTTAKRVATLRKKYKVRVLSENKKWAYVQYGEKKGYVLKKYLKYYTAEETVMTYEAVPEATPTPMPTPFIPEETPEPTPMPTPFIPEGSPVPALQRESDEEGADEEVIFVESTPAPEDGVKLQGGLEIEYEPVEEQSFETRFEPEPVE